MLSDYVVAVTLSEADIAQEVADEWIASGDELKMSAGYSCYCWLVGHKKDETFSEEKLSRMLDEVAEKITSAPNRTKVAMHTFIYSVGISYKPLHEKAKEVAEKVGIITFDRTNKKPGELEPMKQIQQAIEKDRIGFKRKYVRC